MGKRFWIICSVVGFGLLVLSILGLLLLGRYEQGLQAQRRQDFMTVAEQIRLDVKRKLDAFIQVEQARPYTDYQYTFVPEATNQVAAFVRSPLAESFTNGLATGYFQLDSDGQVTTPYAALGQENTFAELTTYLEGLRSSLVPSLKGTDLRPSIRPGPSVAQTAGEEPKQLAKSAKKTDADRRSVYPVSSFDQPQDTQVLRQTRAAYEFNNATNEGMQTSLNAPLKEESETPQTKQTARSRRQTPMPAQDEVTSRSGVPMMGGQIDRQQSSSQPSSQQEETVQVRIEPFVPVTVSRSTGQNGVFAGQTFLIRHIQVEGRHWVQGFGLNESELLSQVNESARRLLRRGMGYEISGMERPDAVHTAVLDFGFGELVLNLQELGPDWIQTQTMRMQSWFWGILGVVWLAVVASMMALWKNMHEQIQLSQQKDDFISAVSHELRTPLASIRMYTEMLENDWIKSDAKRRAYYTSMRQESERLTRLIENVLDFSRIQRGKKQYNFTLGDINELVRRVSEMLRPGIEQAGFTLVPELANIEPFMFDRDTVTQIIINLLDNAVKYARTAEDKRIFLRTRQNRDNVVIEVEDRGPGIPRSRHTKIFDTFYRCEEESTRQTTGTGLGLALVKGFAQAHNGSVEVSSVKPSGVLFRITLSAT
jgi:signal transduction histidine kinase